MSNRKSRVLVALLVSVLLGGVALAQVNPAKKKDKEAAGPLDRPEAPADVAKNAEPAEEAESADDEPQPEQKYEELPFDGNLKGSTFAVNQMLMAGKFAAGQQATFDEYYERYALARWTQLKDIANLPNFRQELRNQFRKKSAAADVHDHLNSLVLEFMKKLAAGPYHPAVQINAMLTIGELNGAEWPPTPLPEALGVMISAAENEKLSDAVRAAAMVGIGRHVAAGVPDGETRKMLTTAMLKVAADLPSGADSPARQWILAQTLETLGRLGSPGENNAAFQTMLKALANVNLSLSTRAVAAEAMGRLNYAGAAGIKPLEAATAIGQFAVDACSDELRLVEQSGYPVSRRRMKQRLGAALLAISGGEEDNRKGIASLTRDQKQLAVLAELQKTIAGLMDLMDDKQREGEDLEVPVDELRTTLETWLKKKG